MAQPSILKAKKTDRPALRDLANFVVPRASHKWYFIGLQLFDPNDVEVLNNMRAHTSRNSGDNCIDVFNYWLDTDVNANWQKIIDALKCQSVYLPNVAKEIENMLSGGVWKRRYRKVKKIFKGDQMQQLQPVPECHSVNNDDPEGRSNFYQSHDDGVKSSYEGDEYETSPPYNCHSATLPRSTSQQHFNFDSHEPRKRSASIGENQFRGNGRVCSLSDLDQQHSNANSSPGWSPSFTRNSNDAICPALEKSCQEMIDELQQKFESSLIEQKQSTEILLKQSIADLQKQLDSTESSINKKSEKSINNLQQQIDKLESMVQGQMLGKNANYTKTDSKEKEILNLKETERKLQSTIQKLKDEHDRKLREIQNKNALDIKRLQAKFDKEHEMANKLQQELSEIKRQNGMLKENYNKVVIEKQNLQNALEKFQSEIGKQKLDTETVAKITDASTKFVLTKAVPKLTGTPARIKETSIADSSQNCSISARVNGTDVTKPEAKFTKTPAKDGHSQTLENLTETATKTIENLAKFPVNSTTPVKETESPAMVTKPPTVVPRVVTTMVAKISELATTVPPMAPSMVTTPPVITPAMVTKPPAMVTVLPPVVTTMVTTTPSITSAMVSSMVTTTPVMTPAMVRKPPAMVTKPPAMVKKPPSMVTETPTMVRVTKPATVVPPVVSTMVTTPPIATMVPTAITKAPKASATVIAIQPKEPLTTKPLVTKSNDKEHKIDEDSMDKSTLGVLQSTVSVPQLPSSVAQSPSTVPQSPPSVPQSSSTEPQSPSTEPQSPSTEPQSPSVNTPCGPRITSVRPKSLVQDEKQSTNNADTNQLNELLAKRRARNSNPNALQDFEESVRRRMKENRDNARQDESGKYFIEQPGDRGIESELLKKLQKRINKS